MGRLLGKVALLSALFLVACGGPAGGGPNDPDGGNGTSPEAVSGLTVRVQHDGSVRLQWAAGPAEGAGIAIYREVLGSGLATQQVGSALAELPAGTTEYVDSSVAPGETYRYQLGATWAGGSPVLSESAAPVTPLPAVVDSPFVWPDAWSATPAANVTRGGVLRLPSGSVLTLNPLQDVAVNLLLEVLEGEGASLVRRGPGSDEWLPYAAESWTITEIGAGGVIDVRLREGLRWSDGAPLTAADYVFRYTAEKDPATSAPNASIWAGVTLEATSDHSLKFSFDELHRFTFAVLARSPLPDHILGKIYREEGADALRQAWGADANPANMAWSGPWTLFESDPVAGRFELVRNPHYGAWNTDSSGARLPHVDTLILTTVAGSFTDYMEDRIDVSTLNAVSVWQVENQGPPSIIKESVAPAATSSFLTFNWNLASDPFLEDLFRNHMFRRAMSHLMDRERIAMNLFGGAATPQWTSVYLARPHWVEDDVAKFPYDPEEASRILQDELGFVVNEEDMLEDAAGRQLAFTILTVEGYAYTAFTFAESAAQVGVAVTHQIVPFNHLISTIFEEGNDRGFEALVIGLSGGSSDWPHNPTQYDCTDASTMWNKSGACLAGWEAEIAELATTGLFELDDGLALGISSRIQKLEAEHQPAIYTVAGLNSYAWRTYVHGEHPAAFLDSATGPRQLVLTWVSGP